MKLNDIMEKKEETKGTYAGVRLSKKTTDKIKSFQEENKIPNPLPVDEMHSTLLYSRKHCPDYKPAGDIDPPWVGTPTEFDVWDTHSEDEDGNVKKCLVLKFDCDELTERHEALMKEHGATFDYDEYVPHITFSYDVGDLEVDDLDPSKLGDLEIVTEYGEDLRDMSH